MVLQDECFPDFSTNQLLLRQGHRVKNGRASPSWLFLSFAPLFGRFWRNLFKKVPRIWSTFSPDVFPIFRANFPNGILPSPVDKRVQEQREGQARLFARVNSSHVKPVYQLYGFRVDQSRTCCGNVLDTSHMAYGVCQDEDSQPSEWSVSRIWPCRRLNALEERKITLWRISRNVSFDQGQWTYAWKRSTLVISVG